MQEIDDLLQAFFGFVLARDVVELDAGLVVDDILLGARFAAEQHRVAAAHILHAFGKHVVGEPEQQDDGQETQHKAEQRVPDRGGLVDGAEIDAGVLQPADKLGILRDGVGLVGVFLFIDKEDLLVLQLDGGKFFFFQHLQKGAVTDALDAGLHHGREQKQVGQQQQPDDDGIAGPQLFLRVFGGRCLLHRCSTPYYKGHSVPYGIACAEIMNGI